MNLNLTQAFSLMVLKESLVPFSQLQRYSHASFIKSKGLAQVFSLLTQGHFQVTFLQ